MTQPTETTTGDSDRIRPGMVLSQRYSVQEVIGYGGMSTVYRGRDTLLDREVAIKVLNQQLGSSEVDKAAFMREARAAASLSHAGIVGTFDAGVFNGWPYIVMELVPGGSLKEIIDTRAPLPPDVAVDIALSLADALDYGHHHGIVHCDVKPQNVLLDAADRPKLVDFGISQSMAATAALTATVSGTAGYVAPEQLEGLPLDGRADVYSLGTVLYQMLTRVLPFEAPNLTALATRRLVADPRPIRDANPAIPPQLATIVMHCLARSRDDRFGSAGELANALRAYQRGAYAAYTEPLSPPVVTEEPTQLWRRPASSAQRELVVERPGPRIFWPLALLLAVLLGALAVVAFVILPGRNGGSTGSAAVPRVTSCNADGSVRSTATASGSTADPGATACRVDAAATALQQAGLKVGVNLVASDQPFGTVLTQDPAPGTMRSANDPVVLQVSRGQQ